MTTFDALLATKTDGKHAVTLKTLTLDDLMPGDVTVKVSHSTVNYKDGLAVTAGAPIIRNYPLIPGIDFAGEVVASGHAAWKPGDAVVLNGWGVGEGHHGGFAGMARVNGDWLIRLPEGMSAASAMAIGTAGYTAMLSVMALEEHSVTPQSGAVLVTGAAGGVGTTAIALLKARGYRVVASTGRLAEADFLRGLGAAEVVDRAEFSGTPKPLAKARFAGAIDSVGSTTLVNVLSQIQPEGSVAACGLAQGMDLPGSVAPFILRGVKLLGINSVTQPLQRRIAAWSRLARDLDAKMLASLTSEVSLADVPRVAADIVAGQVRGRTVVRL